MEKQKSQKKVKKSSKKVTKISTCCILHSFWIIKSAFWSSLLKIPNMGGGNLGPENQNVQGIRIFEYAKRADIFWVFFLVFFLTFYQAFFRHVFGPVFLTFLSQFLVQFCWLFRGVKSKTTMLILRVVWFVERCFGAVRPVFWMVGGVYQAQNEARACSCVCAAPKIHRSSTQGSAHRGLAP